MNELVTVVTSTWQRPLTLMRAIQSVKKQTYPNVEHVVVVDGTDQDTVEALMSWGFSYRPASGPRRLVELGRNWSLYSGDGGFGATCRLVGSWVAGGEFITYLDDDVTYSPEHLATMVEHFDPDTDFVTCPWDGPVPQCPGPPPGVCRTDTSTIMHRAMVLKKAGGFHPDGYAGDGHMVERWLAAGLTWKFREGATVHHPDGVHHGGQMP